MPSRYQCLECGKHMPTNQHLVNHYITKHEKEPARQRTMTISMNSRWVDVIDLLIEHGLANNRSELIRLILFQFVRDQKPFIEVITHVPTPDMNLDEIQQLLYRELGVIE